MASQISSYLFEGLPSEHQWWDSLERRSVQLSDEIMMMITKIVIILMILISLLCSGQFNCQLCDKSFRTPTFLIQHYVSPHFRNELRRLEHLETNSISLRKVEISQLFLNSHPFLQIWSDWHRTCVNCFPPLSEFSAALASKKCCLCNATFDQDAKLMMHLGATHKEVNFSYRMNCLIAPSQAKVWKT